MPRNQAAMEDPGPDSRTPLLEGAENSSEEESPQQEALVDQHEPDVLSNASTVRRRNFYRRTASLMLSPVTDEVDSLSSVLVGLLTMFLLEDCSVSSCLSTTLCRPHGIEPSRP